jgi:hypothetical protein
LSYQNKDKLHGQNNKNSVALAQEQNSNEEE